MKTNFKKLALVAGVTAAMAGGSMSAHAVIQAVPAPAVLVPLFTTQGGATSHVRLEVPSSVGSDSIINLFGGPNGTKASTVATGLSPVLSSNVLLTTSSRLHWVWLDENSNEILNGVFPVSANDVVEFNTGAMPSDSGDVKLYEDTPGYLVIVNQSAYDGEAPLFSFQADAYVSNGKEAKTYIANIPVIPLTDSADGDSTGPTLANNVLEKVQNAPSNSTFGDRVITSPIVSGHRVGIADAKGAVVDNVRVFDLPVYGKGETYVVWNDRNGTDQQIVGGNVIKAVPGLTGATASYNCNEGTLSGSNLSFMKQLNFVSIGETPQAVQEALNVSKAIDDGYAAVAIGRAAASDDDKNSCYEKTGFIRWFAKGNGFNASGVKSAVTQSAIIFRLPGVDESSKGYGQFPVDRGFFLTE